MNFDWAAGSPATGIPNDNFTVRWTGRVTPRYSERYTFSTLTDDGIRVWVNNQLIINNWTDHGSTLDTGSINLLAGQSYDLKIEFYEAGEGAVCKFFWQSASQSQEAVPAACLSRGVDSFTHSTDATLFTTGHDGSPNGALAFNGVSSSVQRPGLHAAPDHQMTFAAWVKTSGVNGAIFALGRSAANNNGGQLLRIDANGRLSYADHNEVTGLGGTPSSVAVHSGSWRHIAFVKDGGNGTYYVDGQPAGTVTGADVAHVANDFVLGRDPATGSDFFNGALDEVRLYTRALSAAEILEISADAQAVSLGDTATVLQSSAGGLHTLFVTRDGSLWGTGDNSAGQLGDQSTVSRTAPVWIASGVVSAVAGADKSSHFLKTDGSLWAMGLNAQGQLGDGTTTNRLSPVRLASNVVAVAKGGGASDHYTLFLKADGTVWATGANTQGQLGDGTTSSRLFPVQVFSGVKAIAAGARTSAFLKHDGTLWMSGSNASGQFGTGSITGNALLPVQVATSVTAVAAGAQHMVWVAGNAQVWAAGSNGAGQLGDGTTTDRAAAVRVGQAQGLVGAAVFAAGNSTLVLNPDGQLFATGANASGQLGDGTTSDRTTPVQIASGVASASAGLTSLSYTIKGVQSLEVGELLAADVRADGSLPLYGRASSGLPVVWTKISGPATLENNMLVFSGTGTVSIQASQPGNDIYAAAAPVVRMLAFSRQFQQLTVELPATMEFDPLPFTLDARATSQLPVQLTLLSGPGTLDGGTLRLLGTGTLVLKATQSGNADYLAAPDVQRNLTVLPAPAVIQTGSLAAKTFGDNPFVLTGTSNSGLPITFTQVSGPGEVSDNTVTLLGGGTLVVRASVAANANYLAGSVLLTIPVAKATQQISFGVLANRTFLDVPVVLGATASSGLGVGYTVLSGPGTISGGVLTITGAGTILVGAAQEGDNRFHPAEVVERTLVVARRPAEVTLSGPAVVDYDGLPKELTVATLPVGLQCTVTYNGKSERPVRAGNYLVVATIADPNYQGSAQAALTIGPEIHPSILVQPVGGIIQPGDPVELKVLAAGSPTLQYQWLKGGAAVSGGTAAVLSLGTMQAAFAGNYTVEVSNTVGKVLSQPVDLVYGLAPSIVRQPVPVDAKIGDEVELSVGATGVPEPKFVWKRDGVVVEGATSSILKIGKVASAGTSTYSVLAYNFAGEAESQATPVKVREWVLIVTQPPDSLYTTGNPVAVPVAVDGYLLGSATYQWFKDGLALAGATGATLTLQGVATDAGTYQLKATAVAGEASASVLSSNVTVLVGKPVVSLQPPQWALTAGTELVWKAVAASDAPLTYQWRRDGVNLEGETGQSLKLTALAPESAASAPGRAGTYDVLVSAGSYGATTASGTLSVYSVNISRQPESLQVPEGAEAIFAAEAGGYDLHYRWYCLPLLGTWQALADGDLYEGAASSVLKIKRAGDRTVGRYRAEIVSGGFDGAFTGTKQTTQEVQLGLFEPVKIERAAFASQAQALNPNQTVTLFVGVQGTAPFAYQWFRNGVPVEGGTQASLRVSAAELSATGATEAFYAVQVSNSAQFFGAFPPATGQDRTEVPVLLTVKQLPLLGELTATSGWVVDPGAMVNLSITAQSLSALSFQWRLDGVPVDPKTVTVVSSGTASSLSFKLTGAAGEGNYDVVVTNVVGARTSESKRVALSVRPVVLESELLPRTLLEGQELRWSGFSATGTGLTYKWKRGATVLDGQTSQVLFLPAVTLSDAGDYTVEASDSFGIVSSTATLRVLQAVDIQAGPQSPPSINLGQLKVPFAVTATGTDLKYQWMRNGLPITGATGPAYTLPVVRSTDAGSRISVRVYNLDVLTGKTLSSKTSGEALLSLREPVSDVQFTPGAGLVEFDKVVSLSATAKGTAPFSYQWYKDGAAILENGTAQTYPLRTLTAATGSYSVTVANAVNQATSPAQLLTVKTPVSILRHPHSRTVNSGSAVKLGVTAAGLAPLSYQWRKDTVPIPGADAADYVIPNFNGDTEGEYDVVVSNPVNRVTSNAALIGLNDALQVDPAYPKSVMTLPGERVVLEAKATGSLLRYQWRRNGMNLPGATSATLVLKSAQFQDSGDYDVLFTSGAASVSSQSAVVSVLRPTSITVAPVQQLEVLANAPGKGTARLEVVAAGDGKLSYQWYEGAAEIPGAVTNSLTVENVSDLARDFSVAVSGQYGSIDLGTVRSKPVALRLLPLPQFTANGQPQDVSVSNGGAALLQAQVLESGTLSYQWERFRAGRWAAVSGAADLQLSLSPARPTDAGLYRLVVENARGKTYSRETALAVRELDVIDPKGQPAALVTVNPGDVAVFSVLAKGVDLSYQWRRNGVPVPGATSSILRVVAAPGATPAADKLDREGVYDVQVNHSLGTSLSSPGILKVRLPAVIVQQPRRTALAFEKPFALSVKASGDEPIAYQWRKNGANIEGATESSLSVSKASAADVGSYEVLVSNLAGSELSATVEAYLPDPVNIISQPVSVTVRAGEPVSFAVVATGSPLDGEFALSYQWRKDGVELQDVPAKGISGTRSPLLKIASADLGDAVNIGSTGGYDVVVSGAANTLASLPATLTVQGPPVVTVPPERQVVNVGDAARFTVVTRSATALEYQWYLNGALLSDSPTGTALNVVEGSNTSALVVKNVARSEETRSYTVRVTNRFGTVTTPGAELRTLAPLSLKPKPKAPAGGALAADAAPQEGTQVRRLGESIVFSQYVEPSDDYTTAFQWRRNGVVIPGATGSSYTIAKVAASDAGAYDAVISATVKGEEKGRMISAATFLKVLAPPVIAPMAAQTARPGQRALLVPVVSGGANLVLSWSKVLPDGTKQAVTGAGRSVNAQTGVLTLDAATESDSGVYELFAKDDNSETGSTAQATLTVGLPIEITLNPGEAVQTLNLRQRFKIVATPTSNLGGSYRYQWRFNGLNIYGAVRQQLDISSVQLKHAGVYDVVVSNGSERATSKAVQLKVRDVLRILTQPKATVTVNPGQPIELSVGTSWTDGATYQWVKGVGRATQVLAGKTGKTLRIDQAVPTDEGVYMVVVTGPSGSLSSALSRVTVNKPVTIISPKEATLQTTTPGSTVEFRVQATGTGPFTYQWLRNGAPIPGGTNPVLRISKVSAADSGEYQARVGNVVDPAGVLSKPATLAVSVPAFIVNEPGDIKVAQGGSLNLAVTAGGDGLLKYQWRRNGVPLAGENRPELSRANLSVFDTGLFDVEVRNYLNTNAVVEIGRVFSRKISVQVIEKVSILAVPSSQSAAPGGRASFRVLAAGTGPLQYSWSRVGPNGLEPLAVRGDTFNLAVVKEEDFAKYQVSIVGPLGGEPVTIKDFELKKVGVGPEILTQPVAQSVRVGQNVTLRVAMKQPAAPDLTYGWYYTDGVSAGTPVAGATTDTLVLPGVATNQTGYYYVVVSDAAAATMSIPALVFVNAADPIGMPTTAADIAQRKAQQTLFANEGDTVTLRSYAIGDGFRYAWRRLDGQPISAASKGVDAATLVVRNVLPGDAAEYVAAPVFLDGTTPGTKQQPESQVRLPGETAILSAGVQVTGDTRFQWFFRPTGTPDWFQMPGATTSTVRILGVTDADDGDYRLEVTNTAATISSNIARVNVLKPIVSTGVQLSPAAANPGGEVTLTATWTGALLESNPFQWYVQDSRTRGWKVLEGQNAATLNLKGVSEANDANYKVRISGKVGGFVDSAPVRLVVNDPVAFVSGLKLQTMSLVVGERTAFTAAATGFEPRFQWHYRRDLSQPWQELTGPFAQAAAFETGMVTADMGGYYGVTVRNAFSVAGASKANPSEPFALGRLIVFAPPQFVSADLQVSGTVISAANGLVAASEGRAFVLGGTVRSDSAGPVSYAWRKDGVLLPSTAARPTAGQTAVVPASFELAFPSAGKADAGRYELLLTNAYGVTVSSPVNVSVRLNPKITRDPASLTVVDGSSASFRVEAEGDDISFQWFKGTLSSGTLQFQPFYLPETGRLATGPLLSISSVEAASDLNGAFFQVVASNDGASVASAPAKLTVAQIGDVKITEQLRIEGLTNGVAIPGRPNQPPLSLSVTTAGGGVLNYQWRRNGVAIGSGTANTFVLGAASNELAGVYEVVISDEANFVYSSPVTLVVDPHLVSVSVPVAGALGDGLRLEAKAVSTQSLSYKWRHRASPTAAATELVNSENVEGATAPVLLVKAARLSDSGEYQVEVATPDATVTSAWMPLAVAGKVDIKESPNNLSALEGGTAQLAVVATGGGTLKYRWFKDGALVSGANEAVLNIGPVRTESAGSYQAEVSNAAGAVLSEPARLSVEALLAVTVEIPKRVAVGQGVSLLAAVRGVKPDRTPKYQWYRGVGASRVPLAGESKAQLSINPVAATDVGTYTVELSDGVQPPVTGSGTLSLSVVPELRASLASQTVPLGAKVAFAVAVAYPSAKPLKYEWFRGTTKLETVTGGVLRIGSATSVDFSTYTVRVSDVADPTVFVEASAKLIQAVGAASSTLSGAPGAEGTLSAAAFAPWWIFSVNGLDDSGTGKPLGGFWVLERKQVLDAGKVVAVTAGRSAWLWADQSATPSSWAAEEQQVSDAATNILSEFSVIATKEGAQLSSFVLGGTVEPAGDASLYGAPELLSGAYDADRSLDVEMLWSAERVMELEAVLDWDTVLAQLKAALSAAGNAAPKGE